MDTPEDEDAMLFHAAMRGVKPLRRTHQRAAPASGARGGSAAGRPQPPPRARFTRAERQAVLAESLQPASALIDTQPGDELIYRRPGVPDTVTRRLRRGEYRIDAELDLHGLNGQQASEQLSHFLAYALQRRLRCLRVIHGKGMRSGPGGPVLKKTVNTLLRRAAPVLCFASAHPKDGGTGATLVLLGKP
ncbi:MAG: Smr/MutS family protein [Steroidobacteraceae bacterium]